METNEETNEKGELFYTLSVLLGNDSPQVGKGDG